MIFEPGDAVEITLLLLGPEAVKPEVRATGKIAEIKYIALIGPNSPEDGLPVWRQVIRGDSFWVQLIRAVVYFFGTLALFILVAVLMLSIASAFDSFKEKRKKSEREARIREYRRHGELGKVARYLMNIYADNGDEEFSRFARAIEHRQAREDAISKLKESSVSDEVIQPLVDRAYSAKNHIFDGYDNEKIEDELRSAKLLKGEKLDEKLVDGFAEAIKDLAEFLNIDLKKKRDAYEESVLARRKMIEAGPEDASDFPPH